MISALWLVPAFVLGAGCGFIGLGIFATGKRELTSANDVVALKPRRPAAVLPFRPRGAA